MRYTEFTAVSDDGAEIRIRKTWGRYGFRWCPYLRGGVVPRRQCARLWGYCRTADTGWTERSTHLWCAI